MVFTCSFSLANGHLRMSAEFFPDSDHGQRAHLFPKLVSSAVLTHTKEVKSQYLLFTDPRNVGGVGVCNEQGQGAQSSVPGHE